MTAESCFYGYLRTLYNFWASTYLFLFNFISGHNELLQVGEVGTCLYKIVARLENSNNSTQKTQKSGTAADDDKAELNLTLHVNSALAIISRGDDAACKTLSKVKNNINEITKANYALKNDNFYYLQ